MGARRSMNSVRIMRMVWTAISRGFSFFTFFNYKSFPVRVKLSGIFRIFASPILEQV